MLFILTFVFGIIALSSFSEMISSDDLKLVVPTVVFAIFTGFGILLIGVVKDSTLYIEQRNYSSHEVDANSFSESNSKVYQLTVNDGTQNITKYYNLDVNFGTTGDRFKKIIISDEVTEPVVHGYIPKLNDLGRAINLYTFEWRRYEILLPEGTVSFTEAETLNA